ncbi:hypothetical protein ACOJBM_02250 [Rhizobium beringeri]
MRTAFGLSLFLLKQPVRLVLIGYFAVVAVIIAGRRAVVLAVTGYRSGPSGFFPIACHGRSPMRKLTYTILAAALLCTGSQAPAFAQEGYKLTPVLTYKNISHDPEGLWDDSDLTEFRTPRHLPSIYIGRTTTPKGSGSYRSWTMPALCRAIVSLSWRSKSRMAPVKVVASGNGLLGHPVTLSLNYRKVFTEEINDSAQPFVGSYDVEEFK